MGIASKYNKSKFSFQIPENFQYVTLADLAENDGLDAIHKVNAIFINNKSLYGGNGVCVTDTCLVNMPKHLTSDIQDMVNDKEVIEAVNAGLFGFKVRTYNNKNGIFYSVKWLDIMPENEF